MADSPFAPLIEDTRQLYPGLSPFLDRTAVESGVKGAPGLQSEFYPPNERDNPHPGQYSVQFMEATPNPNLLGAELGSHALTGTHPGGYPVNSTVHGALRELLGHRTESDIASDQRAHPREQSMFGSSPDFDAWWNQSRGPAYLRASAFPETAPNWGPVSEGMQGVGARVRAYLQRRSPAGVFPSEP